VYVYACRVFVIYKLYRKIYSPTAVNKKTVELTKSKLGHLIMFHKNIDIDNDDINK